MTKWSKFDKAKGFLGVLTRHELLGELVHDVPQLLHLCEFYLSLLNSCVSCYSY